MKKLLSILALVLALCMLCAVVVAEEETNSGETATSTDIATPSDVSQDDKDVHVYEFDKDDPTSSANVKVIFWPIGAEGDADYKAGMMRVYCTNHPNQEDDIKEYAIYGDGHEYISLKDAKLAVANLDTTKYTQYATKAAALKAIEDGSLAAEGKLFAYVPADCVGKKNGWYLRICISEKDKVTWNEEKGRLEGHDPDCKEYTEDEIQWGHEWSDDPEKEVEQPYRVIKDPTCYDSGILVAYCLNCNISKNEVVEDAAFEVEPLFHHDLKGNLLVVPKVTKVPTCVETGLMQLYCPQCGNYLTEEEADKLGEMYPDAKVTSDYGEYGYAEFNVVLPIDPLNHRLSPWILDRKLVEPTCTEEGKGIFHRICVDCHKVFGTETRAIPALGHDWGEWKTTKAATCTEAGAAERICKRDATHKETTTLPVNPMAHPDGKLTIIEKVDATCAGDGAEGYIKYFCEDCKNIYTEIIPVPAHQWGETVLIEGYCGAAEPSMSGYDPEAAHTRKVQICKVCGEEKLIEDLGIAQHDFNPWELRNKFQPATATENLVPEYWTRYCKICAYQQEAIYNYDYSADHDEPDVHAHNWEVIPAVEATCEHEGSNELWVCTICGVYQEDHNDTTPIPALPHTWDKITEAKEPTCTAEGNTKGVACSVCGAVLVEPTVLPMIDHTWEDVAEVPAGCEVEGTTAGKKCTVCGATEGIEVIPATDHTPETVPAVEPTCTVAGTTAYEVCAICGKQLTDPVVVPALGHKAVMQEVKAPTCTEPGKGVGVVCERCGIILVDGEDVPALGHDYQVVEQAPTCTEPGWTEEVCTRCGDVKTPRTEIPMIEHTWDEGEIVKEATYTENAVKKYTCTVCGETKEEEVEDSKLPLEDAEYTVDEVSVAGGVITGKISHKENTEEAQVYVRVTAYFNGDGAGIFLVPVAADGTFTASTNGAIGVDVAFTFDAAAAGEIEFDAFYTATLY